MQVKSGDCIQVKTGTLQSVKGYAQHDFDTEVEGDFDVRLIGKNDAIGDIVTYNTTKNKVKLVTAEGYGTPAVPKEED
jgi:hypothetical protein